MTYKSGFATIIGRPNVGKSTLLNRIIGEKIAIISDKPQTTRNTIRMVHTEDDFQIIFMDTPGIHKPKNKLDQYMQKVTEDALREIDAIIWLIDHSKEMGSGDKMILEQLKKIKTPKILVINKIDKIDHEELGKIINRYEEYEMFNNIIPISALKGNNVETLVRAIKELLPEGPQYYPSDMITDQPERNLISEIIREKALLYLEQEIPHGVAVDIERISSREDKEIVDISATIYCERDSHKGIIIGKGGRKLKGIGKSAREDIEKLLGSKIFLELWVKVNKNWREKEILVKRMGYK